MATKSIRPGDLLLDRGLADADESKREAARAQWKRLVRALLKMATRLATENELKTGGFAKNLPAP
jgi:hypothetical protein